MEPSAKDRYRKSEIAYALRYGAIEYGTSDSNQDFNIYAFVDYDMSRTIYKGMGDNAKFWGVIENDTIYKGMGDNAKFWGVIENDTIYKGMGDNAKFWGVIESDTIYMGTGNNAKFWGTVE